MKKFWPSLALLIFFPVTSLAANQTIILDISTMVCGPDPHTVKSTLAALTGVLIVQISLEQKTATVTFDDQKSTVDQMLSAMAGAGYAALLRK